MYLRYAHLLVHVTYRDLRNLVSQDAGMFVCLCDLDMPKCALHERCFINWRSFPLGVSLFV